ncbi:hypothetical protein PAP_08235 [Palaeococcus pacificus DY20341]|uniref:Carbohydrate kinase PfkB domain-containing protein n=1 Tax=Palaeococcus pacificus DY20341 TaxID=1343739 RepID=A0A075LTE9_9EURY|nr:sugar kinase [Palaeococcus pacificus]AIF70035.1 hypothetical protein PAP_08235 [Palaeococcus pacificus DY20341]
MKDILSIGEVLVDLKIIGGKMGLHTGGSALNLSFYAEQAGAKVKFIGAIGNDFLAEHIEEELKRLNFSQRPIRVDASTTLVLIKAEGEKLTPIIYRAADRMLSYEIIDANWERAEIVHTSAFALSLEPASTAILRALERAKEEGALISVDPNYRRKIWRTWGAGKEALLKAISMADIVKPSIEDAQELFGVKTPQEALDAFKLAGAKNIILSMGGRGVIALTEENEIIKVPAKNVRVCEPTGAGDSLFGTILAKFSKGWSLKEAIEEGVKVAAKVVSRPGTLVKVD